MPAAAKPYNHRWRKARATYLSRPENALCVMCAALGRTTAANVVDHIVPHGGDTELFWDRDNWQALCKTCHDSAKQSQERTGKLRGAGVDGVPLDPSHHWRAG